MDITPLKDISADVNNERLSLSIRLAAASEMLLKHGPVTGKDMQVLQALTCEALAVLLSNIGK